MLENINRFKKNKLEITGFQNLTKCSSIIVKNKELLKLIYFQID